MAKKQKAPEIAVGSKWKPKDLGETKHPANWEARVMAYADGYVMWRFPYCVPGVMRWNEWIEKFEPVKTHFQAWSEIIKKIDLSPRT